MRSLTHTWATAPQEGGLGLGVNLEMHTGNPWAQDMCITLYSQAAHWMLKDTPDAPFATVIWVYKDFLGFFFFGRDSAGDLTQPQDIHPSQLFTS